MKKNIVIIIFLSLGFGLLLKIQSRWNNPEVIAGTILYQEYFGHHRIDSAIKCGDEIIPILNKKSKDFKFVFFPCRLAEILGGIDTERSRETLNDLYLRDDEKLHLIGSLGLRMHGINPDPLTEKSLAIQLVSTTNKDSYSNLQIAILCLGYSNTDIALEALHNRLLIKYPYVHKETLHSLNRIRNKRSIPILRKYLNDPDSYLLNEVYTLLLVLGDRGATQLAIDRIDRDMKSYKLDRLVEILETVSEKKYGYNKKKWQDWWEEYSEDLKIPEAVVGRLDLHEISYD